MKPSSFLGIKALISIVFGLLFILMPIATMSMYGAELDTTGMIMARFFGASLFAIGLICLNYRNESTDTLSGITLSLFIADSVGFIVALQAQLSGTINALGWFNVLIWLSMALGMAYIRFFSTDSTSAKT